MTYEAMRQKLSEALGGLALRGGYGLGVLASERLAADLLPAVREIATEELAGCVAGLIRPCPEHPWPLPEPSCLECVRTGALHAAILAIKHASQCAHTSWEPRGGDWLCEACGRGSSK